MVDIIISYVLAIIAILDLIAFLYIRKKFIQCNREDKVIVEKEDILLFANYRCRKCHKMFTIIIPKNSINKLNMNGLTVSNKLHHCKEGLEDNEKAIADLISYSNHQLKGIKELTNLDKNRWRI